MRTTVGPLPSAVYWRRRAIVLGAVLLGIIVLFVSCSGNDATNQRGASSTSSMPTPAPAVGSSDSDPSFVDGVTGGGPALPDPKSLLSQQPNPGGDGTTTASALPTAGTGTDTSVTAPAAGTCADAEMSVMPIPAATTVKRGAQVELHLKIKNIGTRTCGRDVGADPQELYLMQGPRKYWSSDDCSAVKGHDVRQFTPGLEREYKITWNGHQSNICTGGEPAGPNPPPGAFELRARLGTLFSNPVVLTFVS